MKFNWTTPAGTIPGLYNLLSNLPTHLLIGGATNSGKSVMINGIIYSLLYHSPARNQFILIDPKRVELIEYKNLPHTIAYASETPDIIRTLKKAVDTMEKRFLEMQRLRVKEYPGGHIYVIIDEFADLMTTAKKETSPLLYRIAQLGRAAHVHLFLATQRPTSDIINGQIKVNIDNRVALRCPTKRDSQNVIDVSGAELLPKYGMCYFRCGADLNLYNVPMVSDTELQKMVAFWEKQITWKYRLFYPKL